MLLVLALLPALIFGPALRGTAWFHAHGTSGGHLHLPPSEPDHDDLGALHAWHDAQHRYAHETEKHQEAEPTPEGLLIELPQILAAAPGRSTLASAASIHASLLPPSPRWHVFLVATTYRPDLFRSGWPPQRAQRSGVAALVRSSHAILI